MDKGLVSVIMPAYNEEKYVGEAIESILAQTYTNWELVIVDDASKDRTAEVIRDYLAKDKRIRLHQFEVNQGACAALNQAMELACGDYICWLSADDKYKNHMLQSSMEYLARNPEKEAVFSAHEFIDQDSKFLSKWDPSGAYAKDGEKKCVEMYRTLILKGNAFNACTMLATAEAFRRAGRFEDTHRYANDYQFMMRLCAYANVGYLPSFNVESRIHAEQVSNEGKNEVDAIRVHAEMMLDDAQRHALYKKAEVEEDRERLLLAFDNRIKAYARLNGVKEVEEAIKQKHQFVEKFTPIVEADAKCSELSQMVNAAQYEDARVKMLGISDDTYRYMDKENFGILLAAVYGGLGENQEEFSTIEGVLEINPENYEAHFMMGQWYRRSGKREDALLSLAKALKYSVSNGQDHEMICGYFKEFVDSTF